MNKELTPLEALKELKENVCYFAIGDYAYPRLDIIETALKEKEKQDILINVIKEVFEFGITLHNEEKDNGDLSVCGLIGYTLKREIANKEKELYRDFILKECFPKELKALKIIQEKRVDVYVFQHSGDLQTYHDMVDSEDRKLTQEEFDLLKEELL